MAIPKNIQPDSQVYSTNEQIRTTTDLQEIVQPEQVTTIENKPIQQTATITPEPKNEVYSVVWRRLFLTIDS